MSQERLSTGAQVSFCLRDAICPDFEQIIAQLGPELAVAGEIVLLSDRGQDQEHFAIVSVPGINVQLIVPVAKLAPQPTGAPQWCDRLSPRSA